MPRPPRTTAIFPMTNAAEKPMAVMAARTEKIVAIFIFSLRERDIADVAESLGIGGNTYNE